ncbi:MAG: UDP-2,3-diacylglucosamine diphosphatase [Halieaceae bacterium]|nr:UDP-2,3-diacylglucosamine diphosphatase [Halieaceae bacterium]
MSDAIYFISDLHLDAARPAVTRALFQFLQDIAEGIERPRARALYILGDLFEFWVGDDDDAPLGEAVADALARFSASGADLYLMHGNRDFLLGADFASRVDAKLIPDPTVHALDGQAVLLMHGDSLCTRDIEYQKFRALARSEAWQADILARSLNERRTIAEQLRKASRDAGSRKAEDIMDVTPEEVDRAMENAGCRVLIHGHTHRPARHDEADGTRWVLGDWDSKGWFLRWQNGEMKLESFPIYQ